MNVVQQGWQCPLCRRIYAPFMTMCSSCGPHSTPNWNGPQLNPTPWVNVTNTFPLGTFSNNFTISGYAETQIPVDDTPKGFSANNWTGSVIMSSIPAEKRCNPNCKGGCGC